MVLFVHFTPINCQSFTHVFSISYCCFSYIFFLYGFCFILLFVLMLLILFSDTAKSQGKNSKMSALKMMQTTMLRMENVIPNLRTHHCSAYGCVCAFNNVFIILLLEKMFASINAAVWFLNAQNI